MKNLYTFLLKGIFISIILFIPTHWSTHYSPDMVCDRVLVTGYGFPSKSTNIDYEINTKPDCMDEVTMTGESIDIQTSIFNYMFILCSSFLTLYLYEKLAKCLSNLKLKNSYFFPIQTFFLYFFICIYYLLVIVGVFNENSFGTRPMTINEIWETSMYVLGLVFILYLFVILFYVIYQNYKSRILKNTMPIRQKLIYFSIHIFIAFLMLIASINISFKYKNSQYYNASSWGFPLEFINDDRSSSVIGHPGIEDKIEFYGIIFNLLCFLSFSGSLHLLSVLGLKRLSEIYQLHQ